MLFRDLQVGAQVSVEVDAAEAKSRNLAPQRAPLSLEKPLNSACRGQEDPPRQFQMHRNHGLPINYVWLDMDAVA